MTDAKTEALQNVIDRVSSYQETAPDGMVVDELRRALDEADVALPDDQVTALAEAIEADGGEVDAARFTD